MSKKSPKEEEGSRKGITNNWAFIRRFFDYKNAKKTGKHRIVVSYFFVV